MLSVRYWKKTDTVCVHFTEACEEATRTMTRQEELHGLELGLLMLCSSEYFTPFLVISLLIQMLFNLKCATMTTNHLWYTDVIPSKKVLSET